MPLDISGDIAGLGKIVQIVRVSCTTNETTTSTSYSDTTDYNITITPTKSTSSIIIIATASTFTYQTSTTAFGYFQITDSLNNAISGGTARTGFQNMTSGGANTGVYENLVVIAYDTPETTNATTYKARIRVGASGDTFAIENGYNGFGQLFAIEVAS